MRRNILSVNRIPKFRSDFSKLVALTSLAFGTACIQIMMSSSPTFAQYTNSQGTTYTNARGDIYDSNGNILVRSGDGDKHGTTQTNAQGATYDSSGNISVGAGDGDKDDYNIFNDPVFYVVTLMGLGFTGWIIYNVRAAKAADKRMEEIYQSLPSELQREFNEQVRENASPKEHLNLLLNMRKISQE
jgi:hypothetical protein